MLTSQVTLSTSAELQAAQQPDTSSTLRQAWDLPVQRPAVNAAIRASCIHAEQVVLRGADFAGMNLWNFARADLWQGAARPDAVPTCAVASGILRAASAHSAGRHNHTEHRENAESIGIGRITGNSRCVPCGMHTKRVLHCRLTSCPSNAHYLTFVVTDAVPSACLKNIACRHRRRTCRQSAAICRRWHLAAAR